MTRPRLILPLLLWLLAGCGQDFIEVRVAGVPEGAALIEVRPTLLPDPSARPLTYGAQTVDQGLDHFYITLGPGATGALVLEVSALSQKGCPLATARAEVPLEEARAAGVSMTLAPVTAGCRLAVRTSGAGAVRSAGAGSEGAIECGARCDAYLANRQHVQLEAVPEAGSYFLGWSGACAGLGSCAVDINQGTIQVSATFAPRKVCSTGGLCWENPLPTGIQLRGVFGASTGDAWIVGENGLILRHDGAVHTQVKSGTAQPLYGIWGDETAPGGPVLWIAGGGGTVLHGDGVTFQREVLDVQESEDLFAIHGAGGEVWAGGTRGSLFIRRKGRWEQVPNPTGSGVGAIWGRDPADVWFAGHGTTEFLAMHWNGAQVVEVKTGVPCVGSCVLLGMWGEPQPGGALWLAGTSGTVLRYSQGRFERKESGTAKDLLGVFGAGADLWAGGRDGTLLRWDEARQRMFAAPSDSTKSIEALSGRAADDLWAVGSGGVILRWNGAFWHAQGSGPRESLYAIAATGPGDVWAAGQGGLILHGDGSSWREERIAARIGADYAIGGVRAFSPKDVWVHDGYQVLRWQGIYSGNGTAFDWETNFAAPSPLIGIGGLSASDLWVVGGKGAVFHRAGSTWSLVPSGTTETLERVWAAGPDDVWIVGHHATLLHRQGAGFQQVPVPLPPTVDLYAVSGSAPDDVWVTGSAGTVLRCDGRTCQALSQGAAHSYFGLWVRDRGEAWVAGSEGTVLRWDGRSLVPVESGTTSPISAIWGTSDGAQEDVWFSGDGGMILRYHSPAR